MKRVLGMLGSTALGILLLASPAYAENDTFPVKSNCNTGWYVNGDEEKLLPAQQNGGFMFDGPSLVHHATGPFTLATVPTDGSFTTFGPVTGNKPLFKMESRILDASGTYVSGTYSTINKTGAGKYWSSKIASGPGSQGDPVGSPADLVGKWSGYTADTTVFSFGVGYANDTGNKALVNTVTFNKTVYHLQCRPSPSPSLSASSSHSASPSAAVVTLPVTGSTFNTIAAVGSGVTLLAVGGALVFLARRRRTEFRSE